MHCNTRAMISLLNYHCESVEERDDTGFQVIMVALDLIKTYVVSFQQPRENQKIKNGNHVAIFREALRSLDIFDILFRIRSTIKTYWWI